MTIEELFKLAETIRTYNIIFGCLLATGIIILLVEFVVYINKIDFSFFDFKPACVSIFAIILIIVSFTILVSMPSKYEIVLNKAAYYIQKDEEKNSQKARTTTEIKNELKNKVYDFGN